MKSSVFSYDSIFASFMLRGKKFEDMPAGYPVAWASLMMTALYVCGILSLSLLIDEDPLAYVPGYTELSQFAKRGLDFMLVWSLILAHYVYYFRGNKWMRVLSRYERLSPDDRRKIKVLSYALEILVFGSLLIQLIPNPYPY